MKLLADECVYRGTVDLLREWKHQVETVQEVALTGQDDVFILGHAVGAGQVLITNDMHFSNILVSPPSDHQGIIVLKIRPRTQQRVHAVLSRFLAGATQESIKNTLVIVDRNKYRVRRG